MLDSVWEKKLKKARQKKMKNRADYPPTLLFPIKNYQVAVG
jgi:hypothetical protein